MGFLGKSLFSISLRELEASVKEIPSVESVVLHRVWPTKISVDIQIREAVAMQFYEGRLWSVSAEGFRIEPMKVVASLPLLKKFPILPEVRSQSSLDPAFVEIFQFLGRLRNGDSNFSFDTHSISEIRWDADRGFSIWSFDSSIEADLGFGHFDRAWRMLDRVLNWTKKNGVSVSQLDASFPTRVIARSKSRLQNSEIGLNLKELVRRKEPEAAVR